MDGPWAMIILRLAHDDYFLVRHHDDPRQLGKPNSDVNEALTLQKQMHYKYIPYLVVEKKVRSRETIGLTFLMRTPHLSKSVTNNRYVNPLSSLESGLIWHSGLVMGLMARSSANMGDPWKLLGFCNTAVNTWLTLMFLSTVTSPKLHSISDTW